MMACLLGGGGGGGAHDSMPSRGGPGHALP